MHIRNYQNGDETELWSIFYHTIRHINSKDYTAEQVKTWASDDIDAADWREKIQEINPFVVEHQGQIIGYSDLQADGYIDHFFCHHQWQRKGVGRMLMEKIHAEAERRNIQKLYSNVSITAKPFFMANGFSVVKEQIVTMRNQQLRNYRMEKIR